MAKKKIHTYCTPTEEGRITVEQRDLFVENTKGFAGYRCRLTLEKLYTKHSPNQREYYFAVVVFCAMQGLEAETGDLYTPDEAHIFLKTNCLYDTMTDKETGEIIKIIKSIASLDIVEMIEFIDRCIKVIEVFFHIPVPTATKDWRNVEKVLEL